MATITTVDNFNSDSRVVDVSGNGFTLGKDNYKLKSTGKKVNMSLTLGNFLKTNPEESVISLFSSEVNKRNTDDLIISISKDQEGNYHAETGNYIGKFQSGGHTIEIGSRFSGVLLNRMLNVANNVFLQDVEIEADKTDGGTSDLVKRIIGYIFIQKLGRAFLLGLPRSYETVNYHDMKVHGNIDFYRFISQDIPFRGKISSSTRERLFVPDIVDVLYAALSKLQEMYGQAIIGRLGDAWNIMKQFRTDRFVTKATVAQAMQHKSLHNHIFSQYKSILEYAAIILNIEDLTNKKAKEKKSISYIINIADLWELYLANLLRNGLSDTGWTVSTQDEITTYEGTFFKRKIIPDIVLRHSDGRIAVFDAKYKRMRYEGASNNGMGDVDRIDFFQIHTYMAHYAKEGNLIAGGLLYPMEAKYDKKQCFADDWIGPGTTSFVVDGIDLSGFSRTTIEAGLKKDNKIEELEQIVKLKQKTLLAKEEKEFIKRIKQILNIGN